MDESTTALKTCNKCGVDQPLDNFYIKSHAPDGHDYKCKTCAKAYRHKHYTDNPDYYHVTGKPRGLLCAKCNSLLTHFGDRPEGLLKVLAYVQRGEL